MPHCCDTSFQMKQFGDGFSRKSFNSEAFNKSNLTRNRPAAIEKIQYLKLYPITMYFSKCLHLQSIFIIDFYLFYTKLIQTNNFRLRYFKKYIVIG